MLEWESIWRIIRPLVKVALILIVGHFIIAYIVKIVERAFQKSHLDPSLAAFLEKTIKIVLYLLIVISALSSLGISTTGIVAAFSAAGLAVAVALKDSLSNVAGGILLLISPRFATGDFIEVEGDSGVVLSVDLLHTTIRTADNRQVSIPNGVLINSHITNYSREEMRRVEITFQVSYDSDVERAKALIIDIISAHKDVSSRPDAPMARVSGYKDSSVSIVSRCWCKTENYWKVYYDLMENIRTAFGENGINIPYNQLDVHIKEK